MKLVAFSDLHAHPHKQGARVLESGVNSRVQDCVDAMDEVFQYAFDHGIKRVLFGGDLFHKRDWMDITAVNLVYEVLWKWSEKGVLMVGIPGNHDQYDKVGKVHSLESFVADCAWVIEDPEWVRLGKGVYVFGIPHTHDLKMFKELLAEGLRRRPKQVKKAVALFHVGVNGAKVGIGRKGTFKLTSEVIVHDLCPDEFDLVLLGDYHLPQHVTKNVHYIGAPLQHSWGDQLERRGFLVIDTDDWSIEHIPTSAPKFLVISPEELDLVQDGDFVKVSFESQPNQKRIDELRKKLSHAQSVEITVPKRKLTAHTRRSVMNLTMHRREILERYTEHVVAKSAKDSDYLLKKGVELLEG